MYSGSCTEMKYCFNRRQISFKDFYTFKLLCDDVWVIFFSFFKLKWLDCTATVQHFRLFSIFCFCSKFYWWDIKPTKNTKWQHWFRRLNQLVWRRTRICSRRSPENCMVKRLGMGFILLEHQLHMWRRVGQPLQRVSVRLLLWYVHTFGDLYPFCYLWRNVICNLFVFSLDFFFLFFLFSFVSSFLLFAVMTQSFPFLCCLQISDRSLATIDYDHVGSDASNLFKSDDHLTTAFGLAALMQNGFPPPGAILNPHNFVTNKPNSIITSSASTVVNTVPTVTAEDKWPAASTDDCLPWTTNKSNFNVPQKIFK